MARYAYKDVVYRADFQALCEGFEAKYGRPLDPDANYDGDYWGVAAGLLEAKDAEIDALRAQLTDCRAVLQKTGHMSTCSMRRCQAIVDGRACLAEAWVHTKVHEFQPGQCTCGYDRVMGEG